MSKSYTVLASAVGAWLMLSAIAGCSASTEASRFYLLSPMPAGVASPDASTADLTIRVVVELAQYADREEIVTRIGPNRYEMADYDRWAESPGRNLSRILAHNLSMLLGSNRVISGEWPGPSRHNYKIEIKFTRLDGVLEEKATLAAHWRILDSTGEKVLLTRMSRFSEPIKGNNYEAFVAAQSRALAAFSREVTKAIKSLAS